MLVQNARQKSVPVEDLENCDAFGGSPRCYSATIAIVSYYLTEIFGYCRGIGCAPVPHGSGLAQAGGRLSELEIRG